MSEATASAVDLAPWFPGMERRASARIPASLHASFRVLGPEGAAGQARVHNLSTLGAGLELPHPVPPSSLLQLEFAGLTRGLLARVVYARAEGGVVGCAFVREMDDATLRLFHAERVGAAAEDCRRWVRFACNVETACYAVDAAPGERSQARVVNISAGGMGLLLPCEFGPGTLLKLDLEGTAAHAAGPILLRVVRASGRPDGDWFLGCEFADPMRDAEMKILLGARAVVQGERGA